MRNSAYQSLKAMHEGLLKVKNMEALLHDRDET